MRKTYKLIAVLLFVLTAFSGNAQFYQIGTGTTQTYYPYRTTWMDARTQMLYLQSELTTAGMTAGVITHIGFEVVSLGLPMNGFNMRIKGTTSTALSAFETTGWTTVYSGSYTVPATGWQMLELQTPFYWNGTDNILIEVCFDNNTYTGASEVYSHTTAFNSVWGQVADLDPGSGCDLAAGSAYIDRPNLRLITLPAFSCGNAYMGEIFPNATWQMTPYTLGNIPIWEFQGVAGYTYDFSMCANTEDSYLRLYDSTGTLLHSVDDYGPFCSSASSSMSWICTADAKYYITASHYSCAALYNSGNLEYRASYELLACPPGAYVENEPDCYDGYIDAFNGGCNSSPEAFSILPNNCSQFVCGKSGVYDSGSTRDTDWYQFTTTDSTELYIDVISEFDMQFGVIDGTGGCPVSVFHTVISVATGVRDTLECVIGPGTWWIWAGSSTFAGCPCGSDYQFNFWTVNNPSQPVAIEDSVCYGIAYLEMPSVPGVEYYWQGSSCGNDDSMPASVPYLVTSTGEYYVRTYNSGTGCWSDECSSVFVRVYDPLTVTATSNMNAVLDSICLGDSIILDADVTGATGSLEYRWREGSTILRDWDPVSEFSILSPSETTYTVDVHQAGGNGKVLVLHADGPNPADSVFAALLNDPRFDSVGIFNAQSATPTLAELHKYSAVITWTNYPFFDAVAVGDTLAQYVDEGGNVLVVAFGLLAGGSGWGITGRFLNDSYSPIVQTDAFNDYTAVPIGTVSNPSHPVLAGITDVTGGYMVDQTLMNTGASDIFWWTNGNLGLAEKSIPGGGKVMAFNAWPGNWGGAHADMLMANILAYLGATIAPCDYSDSVSILIFDIPDAAGAITGDAVVCNETTGNVYSVGTVTDAVYYDWTYSGTGATINGNTNSITIDFAQNATSGTLYVAGVNDCGSGTEASFDITVNDCTGIDESQSNASVVVVPNPSNGQFWVEFSAVPGNTLKLIITNAIGQIVYEQNDITSDSFNRLQLNLMHLPSGTYSVRISGNEVFNTKHFVIQK